MKMKILSAIISAAALTCALSLVSCSKIEPAEQVSTKGWTVSISATASDEASSKAVIEDNNNFKMVTTFKLTDNIYVYNKTQKRADPTPLHPDREGTRVNFVGTLSQEYSEGDELVLCYNPQYVEGKGLLFNYDRQKGDLGSVADYAKAYKTVSAAEASAKELSGTVEFEKMQSIFRFTFPYFDAPIKRLVITTKRHRLVQTDRSCHEIGGFVSAPLIVNMGNPTQAPVYVAMRNESKDEDKYFFLIETTDGFIYQGEKEAPVGKIVNGKLYDSEVVLFSQSKFKVTEAGNKVEPNDGSYGYKDYNDIEANGTGFGQYIWWYYNKFCTITLDNVHLICYDHIPIMSENAPMSIVLKGDSSIETSARFPAICFCSFYALSKPRNRSMTISGIGHLTLTAKNSDRMIDRGILNNYGTGAWLKAAEGYYFTVEDLGDNGDGTSSWLYKVRKSQ